MHAVSQIRLKTDVDDGTGTEATGRSANGEYDEDGGDEDMVLPLRMLGASRVEAALLKAARNGKRRELS